MKENKKILVVAAHPDDEVLGCGGTIIKHIKSGDEVYLIVFTDGVTSRDYVPGIREAELNRICSKKSRTRKTEFNKVAGILGLKKGNIFFYDLPDNRMDSVPLLDIIKRIEDVSSKVGFDIVYTHHWGDLNIDHRRCLEAVITVFRPKAAVKNKPAVLTFEIPGNMDLLPPAGANRFDPDHFVDISGTIRQKVEALKAYKSELTDHPDPRSEKNITLLAQKRARNKKYKFAEAFERYNIKWQ